MDFDDETSGTAAPVSPLADLITELDPHSCSVFAGNGRADTVFDRKKNRILIADIGKNGQQTPVLARANGDAYEVIAGTRRLGAILALNSDGHAIKLKAIVRDLSDEEAWLFAEKENTDRRSLSAMQRARSWSYAIQAFHGGRQDMFAESIGEDPSAVSRTLKLLKVPQEVLSAVKDPDSLSVHFASQLVPLLDDEARAKTIRETARNIAASVGPIAAPRLLDELLSTPSEIDARLPVHFDLEGSPKHVLFKRNRNGSATVALKSIDLEAHSLKSRKALLASINHELKRFLQLDNSQRAKLAPSFDDEADEAGLFPL